MPIRSAVDRAYLAVRTRIEDGSLSREGYLAPVRQLADAVGENRDAVWRACIRLQQDGIIEALPNRRYRVHPEWGRGARRTLRAMMVAVGQGSIRFSGLQRFYDTLRENQARFGIEPALRCVLSARAVEPGWFEGVDAAIFGGFFDNPEALAGLELPVPIVGVSTSPTLRSWLNVQSDNAVGGRLAAELLLARGVRRPYLVGYTRREVNAQTELRLLGFKTAWVEAGRSISDVGEILIDQRNAIDRLAVLKDRIALATDADACFCLDKVSAVNLLEMCEHLGRPVPERLRVVGFDGTFEGLRTRPLLTIVQQQFEAMAAIVAEALRQRAEGGAGEPRQVKIPPKLILRESA